MLITAAYADLNSQLHRDRTDYGTSGQQWAPLVRALVDKVGATRVLDYGCGKQTLAGALPDLPVVGYDPALPGLDRPPEPSDLVVCTDVLEHVEPDCVEDVLDDLCRVARRAAFVTVATRPAVKTLADGRNAHLTVQPLTWWRERFLMRFDIVDVMEQAGHEFALILRALHAEDVDLAGIRIADHCGTSLRAPIPAAPKARSGDSSSRATDGVGVVKIAGKRLQFSTPNDTTRWRVETLMSKEPGTIEWLDGMQAGETLVDVGANVGMYAIYAAVMRGVRVHAFEPEAQNFALLNRNVAMNELDGRVTAYPLALSDARGAQVLHLSAMDAGGSCHSVGAEVGFDLLPRASAFRQGTFTVTIDELVAAGTIPAPDHIKIDVDGFEHKVLTGAATTLTNSSLKSVLVELNTHLTEHLGVITTLESLGFVHDPAQVQRALRKSGPFEGVGEFIFRRQPACAGADLDQRHTWRPPASPTSRAVLHHVLARVAAAPIRMLPFPHLIVDDVLPADYYQAVLANFPPASAMCPLGETGRVGAGAYRERLVTLFNDEHFARLSTAQAAFWRELSQWLYHEQFLHAFTDKFHEALEPRLARIVEADGAVHTRGDALLVNDQTQYAIGPHTDAPHRLVTFLFYFPVDERLSDLGTSLYRPRDPAFTCWGGPHHPREDFEKVATVEFIPNRLVAFPKTERSFHGVEPILRDDVSRHLLINNIRLTNRVTH